MYKQETKTVWDIPPGFLGIEDKIMLAGRLQEMQAKEKASKLTDYTAPDYAEVIKQLLDACSIELKAQRDFFAQQ